MRPINKLLIALRFYAVGSVQRVSADFGGVCSTTACQVIKEVSTCFAELAPTFVRMPENGLQRIESAAQFHAIANFPRVIGTIDCTHIQSKVKPHDDPNPEQYRNRKGWYSVNVQAIVSADYRILDIVSRWPGRTHDQAIFDMSRIKRRFERGDFGHFVLVADNGYRNTSYMITPFSERKLVSRAHELMNESQIRTRNPVEKAFGVWKIRFPVLRNGIRLRLDTVQIVISAWSVLHNIAIKENDILPREVAFGFSDSMESIVLEGEEQEYGYGVLLVAICYTLLTTYELFFCTRGFIQWQWKRREEDNNSHKFDFSFNKCIKWY